jgi:hypothetical protein
LHGEHGPDAARVREALGGWIGPLLLAGGGQTEPPGPVRPALIIRAVAVTADETPDEEARKALRQAVADARAEADLVLFDARSGGHFGGTGTRFPWVLAREAGEGAPFLVAGGIDAESVESALEKSGAWGVDVSGGVEVSPGIKDAELMKQLVARVRARREPPHDGGKDGRQEGRRK